MLNKNPYTWMGLGLLTAGTLVSPVAYFILDLTWLSALGICMLILSLILLTLGRTIPKLPPEACGLLLETGVDNMAALIEELGIRAKATYLPSSLTNGRPQAFIPLHSNTALPSITTALPQRLIVRYGSGPDDVGLLLSTIGSNAVSLLESKPGPSSIELESALTSLFSGILGVADRTVVACNENHIKVEIHNPHLENGTGWSHHCFGGPLASVVAAVAAEAWDRPVTIEQEEQNGSKYFVELEVKE
ncbi:MAG TPA: hypothetical protein VMW00_06255 [Dehalococcoidales bacterium]|nr:hypothetical protein [Dehalococcoidales bacterium]